MTCRDAHRTTRRPAARLDARRRGAKKAIAEIWGAEDKTHARAAVKAFAETYGAKFPKAVAKITEDLDQLLAFYDYPAEHWVHLRTPNPIESTFATARHRTKITRGPGSKAAGLAMAFKLIMAAQDRWRAVNAPHPRRARASRGQLRQRQARRTRRRSTISHAARRDRGLTKIDPQVLTIAPMLRWIPVQRCAQSFRCFLFWAYRRCGPGVACQRAVARDAGACSLFGSGTFCRRS